MNNKEKSRKYFNKTSKYYYSQGDGVFAQPTYEEVIPRVINENPKVMLDLGCGTGDMIKKILNHDPDIQVYGLDISPKMVKKASTKFPEGCVKVGDSEHIPWDDESFDLVVCNSAFHHFPNPTNVLNEINRVLKKDGKLIMGEPTAPGLIRRVINIICRFGPHGDYRIYNKREIKFLLKRTNFELENFKLIDEKHYAFTAIKL